MSVSSCVVILILAASSHIVAVSCMKCAQCASVNTRSCESGKVVPTDCTGLYQGAKFCVTYTGTIRRGRVVFRDCSYVDMESICKSQLLENEETEVCYETCDTDGCNTVPNSGPATVPTSWWSLIAILSLTFTIPYA